MKESNLGLNIANFEFIKIYSNHPIVGFTFTLGILIWEIFLALIFGLTYGGILSSLSVLFYIPIFMGLPILLVYIVLRFCCCLSYGQIVLSKYLFLNGLIYFFNSVFHHFLDYFTILVFYGTILFNPSIDAIFYVVWI